MTRTRMVTPVASASTRMVPWSGVYVMALVMRFPKMLSSASGSA